MTKKHFQVLAANLRTLSTLLHTSQQREVWRKCVENVADTCAESNPRFDRTRFLYACGCVSEDEQNQCETDRATKPKRQRKAPTCALCGVAGCKGDCRDIKDSYESLNPLQ